MFGLFDKSDDDFNDLYKTELRKATRKPAYIIGQIVYLASIGGIIYYTFNTTPKDAIQWPIIGLLFIGLMGLLVYNECIIQHMCRKLLDAEKQKN